MKKLLIVAAFCLSVGSAVLLNKPSYVSADTGGVTCPGQGGTGTSTAFTSGSVVFSTSIGGGCGTSTSYSQDNTKIFWDDSLFDLGLATSAPVVQLDMGGNYIGVGSAQNLNPRAGLKLPSGTTSVIQQSSAAAIGVLVVNTSLNVVCLSTGTSINQWVKISTGGAVSSGCDR